MLMVVIRKIRSLFCLLLHLVERCFCCFKRRINGDRSLPITVSSENNFNTEVGNGATFENWDSWDGLSSVISDGNGGNQSHNKGPQLTPLQKQIQEYRLSQQRKLTELSPDEPEEPNYLQELVPKIIQKPQVVILPNSEEDQQISNRISLSLLDTEFQGSELLDWTEDGQKGWEEAEDLNVDAALREQKEWTRQEKRAERLKRKAEKESYKLAKHSGVKLATKLS